MFVFMSLSASVMAFWLPSYDSWAAFWTAWASFRSLLVLSTFSWACLTAFWALSTSSLAVAWASWASFTVCLAALWLLTICWSWSAALLASLVFWTFLLASLACWTLFNSSLTWLIWSDVLSTAELVSVVCEAGVVVCWLTVCVATGVASAWATTSLLLAVPKVRPARTAVVTKPAETQFFLALYNLKWTLLLGIVIIPPQSKK